MKLAKCRLCKATPIKHPRNDRTVYHPVGGCSLGIASMRLPIGVSDWQKLMSERVIEDIESKFSPENLRRVLFDGWPGCSNHDCVVTGPKSGMGTNGSCSCLHNATRTQLNMLKGRISGHLFVGVEK